MARQGFKVIEGSITAPQGFVAGGVFCDIKRLGTGKGSQKGQKRDLGLILSMVPSAVAGLYTTNQVCAAPVKVCAERTAKDRAQAIVANSGNANACTGLKGRRDAEMMTKIAAKELNVQVIDTLVCSTGRIGVQMPMENVTAGILAASKILSESREAAAHFAEAIMTSDSRAKEIAVELTLGGKKVRIGGVCKGAGMIQPGMSPTGARPASALHATMLGFVTTDAKINAKVLKKSLEIAVAQSFNRITVDGDMSTNDTVLILANGLAGNKEITRTSRDDLRKFEEALNFVCLELAKMIVRDGEGVSRFVTVRLHGAKNSNDAEAAARAVANSSLVKTSWFGGDPNWGRILDALGYSAAMIIEDKIDVGYSRPGEKKITYALKRGQPTSVPFKTLCKAVAEKEFDLHIHLNLGSGHAVIYTCDLTEEYVEFNKGDVSDPTSLGG
jgi:glutamate N-acetyltransferase/amino-acid N-acetyltransferase